MAKKPKTLAAASRLRRRAETRLRKQRKKQRLGARGPALPADTRRLVHELEVHQIELEMQNEELSRATARAEASADKFSDRYEFAPAGCLTLDQKGVIRQANLRRRPPTRRRVRPALEPALGSACCRGRPS
jgi:hypothetical protein